MPRVKEDEQLEFVRNRIRDERILAPRDRMKAELGRKTQDEVFDRSTLLTLWRLIHRNVIDTLDYPVSTGKEANVFHATDPKGQSVAVKIFRVSNATFYAYKEYIQGDPRFESIKGNRRELIHAWVKKEYKNLLRLQDAGIRVPAPIQAIDNVLCMAFVGEAGTPAPLLKDVMIEKPEEPYDEMMGWIATAWKKAQLVHGDMSAFNVLVDDNGITLIDVGQAVVTKHPMAREFLRRDVDNVTRFFRKLGVETRRPAEVVSELLETRGKGA